MLAEVAAEVLLFLGRRDLDKVRAVSKWLDALIAQSCEVYPLRPVLRIVLNKCGDDFALEFWIGDGMNADHTFASMDEAARFTGSVLRHSDVYVLLLGGAALSPDHWTALIDATHYGAVRRLEFNSVDFSALGADALLAAVDCAGLQSLHFRGSVVPSGPVTDDLIRLSVEKGLIELLAYGNQNDTPLSASEDVVLDFFFREGPTPEGQPLRLVLDDSGVTDAFLTKFFERLLSGTVRPSGSLMFKGAAKQRGLSAYARFLTPGGIDEAGATYRFPPADDDSKPYEIDLSEPPSFMTMRFQLVDESP